MSNRSEWRRGIPTREVMDAQVQDTDAGPICAFQARHYGHHATVYGCFDPREGAVRWDMQSPLIGAKYDGVHHHTACVRVYPAATWEFRPVDVWEGDPLPWKEPGPDTAVDWVAAYGAEAGGAAP